MPVLAIALLVISSIAGLYGTVMLMAVRTAFYDKHGLYPRFFGKQDFQEHKPGIERGLIGLGIMFGGFLLFALLQFITAR